MTKTIRNKKGQFAKGNIPWSKGRIGFCKNPTRSLLNKVTPPHLGKENKWGHHTEKTKKIISEKKKGTSFGYKFPKGHPRYNDAGYKKGNIPWSKEHGFSEATRKKMSEHNCMKRTEIKEKARNSLIEGYESGRIKPNSGTFKKGRKPNPNCYKYSRPNKPETILKNIIERNNLPFNFVGNGKIWFEENNHFFNPDFLSQNPKHIIEVFGDYWHNIPKNKERDKERLLAYSKLGYKTLIIWEHELKNENNVLNKVINFLKWKT